MGRDLHIEGPRNGWHGGGEVELGRGEAPSAVVVSPEMSRVRDGEAAQGLALPIVVLPWEEVPSRASDRGLDTLRSEGERMFP